MKSRIKPMAGGGAIAAGVLLLPARPCDVLPN